jgi:CheY-like chemotaxis protein
MKKILIVDDHAEMRRLLGITLSGDYEVLEAGNGEYALAMVQLHQPDAILLDIAMQGELDGLQVLKRIRQCTSPAPPLLVLVTASASNMDGYKGSELGADAYFVKPFSPLQIVKWLHQNLE